MTTDFDGYQRALVRPFGNFGKPKAQMWFGFTGRYKDAELDKLRTAREERYPDDCGEDALPYVASTFNLQKLGAETQQAWRTRLQGAWPLHKFSGTESGLGQMLEAAGWVDVIIDEGFEFGNWGGDYYSKVRITATWPDLEMTVIPNTLPFQLGHNIPNTMLRETARIVRQFKSAHALPFELFVLNTGGTVTVTIPLYRLLGANLVLPFVLGAFEEF